MNPCLEEFLARLRRELNSVGDEQKTEETMLELRAHLEQCVADLRAEGHPAPEEEAIKRFGDKKQFVEEMDEVGKRSFSPRDKTALRLAFSLVALIVGADLLMEASAWVTGSDISLWGLVFPATALWIWYAVSCVRATRIHWKPLTVLIAGAFVVSTLVGGVAEGVQYGGRGVQTRGTAYRRMGSLIKLTLPEMEREAARFRRGAEAFSSPVGTEAVKEFQTDEGFLAPEIQNDVAAYGPRYAGHAVGMTTVPTYEIASKLWAARSAEANRLLAGSVQGYKDEIKELSKVTGSSYLQSVELQNPVKCVVAIEGFILLLSTNAVGFVIGSLLRRRNRDRAVA